MRAVVSDLNGLRRASAALHQLDCEGDGFGWIEANAAEESHFAWARFGRDGARPVVVACNFTPVERHRRLGVPAKKFPSSVEALLRRAMKGGEPFSIHPVVDFYNAVCLAHVVPVGGFDLSDLGAGLDLRLSRPGDTFQALDDAAPQPVARGEISWASGSTVLTRHLVWRQASQALIEPRTRDLVLLSEILPELPPGAADAVENDLLSGVEQCFGANARSARLTAGAPSTSLL